MEVILLQMKESICKIKYNNERRGTGFFCFIPFPNYYNLIPAFFTNNHILGKKKDIIPWKKIELSLQNNKITYQLKIDKDRKVFTDSELDVTFIEIKSSDNFNISFLEIDENNIINKEPNIFYQKKEVYLLHYPGDEVSDSAFGEIKSISEDS